MALASHLFTASSVIEGGAGGVGSTSDEVESATSGSHVEAFASGALDEASGGRDDAVVAGAALWTSKARRFSESTVPRRITGSSGSSDA
jgi:hypothetical protein